jgi:hypothetical protein
MPMEVHGRPSFGQLLVVLVVFAGLVFAVGQFWEWAGEYDRNHTRGTLSEQMMTRKSHQLQRLLDGMIAHDYKKVSRATSELERISEAMQSFISERAYGADGVAFRESLESLQQAVAADAPEAAIASVDRVVDSCMRCHERLHADRQRAESP